MKTPKFAHIVLQTSRLAEMRDWYCAVLGAHVVFQNDILCFITFDEEHHRIAFLQPPPEARLENRSPRNAGLNHSAYTYDSLGDLLEQVTALETQGIVPAQPIQHGVTTSLYYRDPDGNFVELQVDNHATPDEATAYMLGPEYAADAVGVGFDPRVMSKAFLDGTPASVLQTRQWALEACPNMPDPLIVLTR